MNESGPITILTRPPGIHPFNPEWLKYYAGKITGKKRGPEMVARSLSRGLAELGVPHRLNPFFLKYSGPKTAGTGTVHVITGAETLKWALRLKAAGTVGTLVVGPAISVVPEDHDTILKNPLIDAIVFPCQWTKDFFASVDPYYENKIEVWPAGVNADAAASSRTNGRGIVYFKFTPPEIRETVMRKLEAEAQKIGGENNGTKFDVFEYGTFRQSDYFAALEKADWLVSLSPSESQGIALQEAWIRDVPTLVWDPGIWNYQAGPAAKNYSWKTPLVSAPYLTAESGASFTTPADFPATFDRFIARLPSFTPRAYCMKKLTDRESAARFLQILEIIDQK